MKPELSSRPLLDTEPDAALFVDRERERARIKRAVNAGLNTLVLGERGMGKSSLLRRVGFDLRAESVPWVFLDGALASDARSLLEMVRYQVAGTRFRSPDLLPEPLVPREAADEPELLLRVVDMIARALNDTIVILLDGLPSRRIAHTLFGRLRDELWQLPITWVVAADESHRAEYLRPPADAFFEERIVLEPLGQDDARHLLFARIEGDVLSDDQIDDVVSAGEGNPRKLVVLARAALNDTPVSGRRRAQLQGRLAALGRPAAMLVAELEALGGASASDERLLGRLGWTRARAVQVLKQLEEAGLVVATDVRGERGGRPRRIYQVPEPILL